MVTNRQNFELDDMINRFQDKDIWPKLEKSKIEMDSSSILLSVSVILPHGLG